MTDVSERGLRAAYQRIVGVAYEIGFARARVIIAELTTEAVKDLRILALYERDELGAGIPRNASWVRDMWSLLDRLAEVCQEDIDGRKSDLCRHEWVECEGEPPVDVCNSCGEVRQ